MSLAKQISEMELISVHDAHCRVMESRHEKKSDLEGKGRLAVLIVQANTSLDVPTEVLALTRISFWSRKAMLLWIQMESIGPCVQKLTSRRAVTTVISPSEYGALKLWDQRIKGKVLIQQCLYDELPEVWQCELKECEVLTESSKHTEAMSPENIAQLI